MENNMSSKAWLSSFLCILLALTLLIGAAAYWIDPFFQFRYEENVCFSNTAKFPGPGLVKNYNYDTLILGSSMTQNFDMDIFRQTLDVQPLHIGIGGMGMDELISYIRLSEEVGKCETYYICIDQYMLTDAAEYRTPEYLFRDDFLSTLRYLFCYEAWFRYIPLDIALRTISLFPVELPGKVRLAMDIDFLGNWENDFSYGEDVVIRNYLHNEYGVSSVDPDGLYARMTEWTDRLFENLPGDKSRYHFFFPPYSVLFWYDAQNDGYFETYLEAKLYFLEKAQACGADVYDFQAAEFVTDLNHYKDITHYRGEINDWMVSCFASEAFLADKESILQGNAWLEAQVGTFSANYSERLGGGSES